MTVEISEGCSRRNTSVSAPAAAALRCVGRSSTAAKRLEIAKSFITGRKSGAEMARLCNISQPTVSRIVAQHRMVSPQLGANSATRMPPDRGSQVRS
jgi:hypothetical protein